jgi:N-acetylglucosamine kinase-like BadF-type ATPase
MSKRIVIAVDGGNSKTDLALVASDGTLLSLARGPLSSPHHVGVDGCLKVLEQLLHGALAQAGVSDGKGPVAEVGAFLMAGVDFPNEERELQQVLDARGWAVRNSVGNDTFAVLRAGTERGWGVAVVCGSGINCVGVAPDGRHARFPALGEITGDWGGGYDVGMAALSAAARSEDGRGPKTSLEHDVPAHFGFSTPREVAEAIHRRQLSASRVIELAPLVLGSAAGDAVAAGIVDRLAGEVVALATAALGQLELTHEPAEVLLGGGLLQAGDGRLLDAIERGLHAIGPSLSIRPTDAPPIVGAALLALDELGAGAEAQARLRTSFVEGAAR